MEPIALTRASQFIHATNTLERLGQSLEGMLAQANLPMWHFSDPDDLVPTQHIHRLMEQAARSLGTRLLKRGDQRITDIGMELGYADSAHFTRAFKRWAGVSPREYRRHQQMPETHTHQLMH